MSARTTTRTKPRATPRRFDWLAALALSIAGVAACYTVVTTIPPIDAPTVGGLPDAAYAQLFFSSPNLGGVALVLAGVTIGTLGGAWFVVRLLHWRFRPTFEPIKVWRQSLWVALFVAVGTWLQLSRALTVVLAVLIAGGFVLVEVFLNVRERQE